MLEDGTYDVVVVDATHVDAPGEGVTTQLRVELAVLAGAHKGEIVALTSTDFRRDPLDLLATPGTIVVSDGIPRLTLED